MTHVGGAQQPRIFAMLATESTTGHSLAGANAARHLLVQLPVGGLADARGQPEQALVALEQREHAPYTVARRRAVQQRAKRVPRLLLHLRAARMASCAGAHDPWAPLVAKPLVETLIPGAPDTPFASFRIPSTLSTPGSPTHTFRNIRRGYKYAEQTVVLAALTVRGTA